MVKYYSFDFDERGQNLTDMSVDENGNFTALQIKMKENY